MAKLRVTYNAPVILTFALAAVVVRCLGDGALDYFHASPRLDGWRDYLGLVSHILGHANWDHLLGNFTIILLIGPVLEERHGTLPMLAMIVATALITGLINAAVSDQGLVGASGIAFMFVVLASLANIRHGDIPLTFIAVVLLFLGREVVGAFRDDQVSQMAHLIGGGIGAAFGFLAARTGSGSATPAPAALPVARKPDGPRPRA